VREQRTGTIKKEVGRRSEITPGADRSGSDVFWFSAAAPRYYNVLHRSANTIIASLPHSATDYANLREIALASRDAEFIRIALVCVWLLIAQFNFTATLISNRR